MATRCCSPPESRLGKRSARSARPTVASDVCRLVFTGADELTHERHVLERGKCRDEIEELEDEAHVRPPVLGERRLVEATDLALVDGDGAARRRLDATDEVHERGLARARRTQYDDELTVLDLQARITQRVHRKFALAEGLVHGNQANDRLGDRRCLRRRGGRDGCGHGLSSPVGLSSAMSVSAAASASRSGSAMRWMRKPSRKEAITGVSRAAGMSPRTAPRSCATSEARLEHLAPRAHDVAHGLPHRRVPTGLQEGLGHEHTDLRPQVELVDEPHHAVDGLR